MWSRGPGIWTRHEEPPIDRAPGGAFDAGMWVLLPVVLSLGGGFLIFIAIFAGEPDWDLMAGGLAVILGVTIATLMWSPGFLVALAFTVVGAFGGWVWEQFRDGASISAVTYTGGGYDGTYWVGHVHNYEERTATVVCRLEALGPGGDVTGTVDMIATDVRPNSNQPVEGEIEAPPAVGADLRARGITPHRNLRGTCIAKVSS
jgi:hypothetical protein